MPTSRAAERQQREAAWIDAVTGDDAADAVVHAGDGDIDDRGGGRMHVLAEAVAERGDGAPRRRAIDPDGVVAERGMTDPAIHREGVGERGLLAAAAVAGGPG
jgi:hypothetical protein